MSGASADRRRGHRSQASEADAGSDNVLCYADQGSFVGLRALGRGPVLHFTWIYSHPLDEAKVDQFNVSLAQSLLGRVLRRSPLPWGRHRWVASPVPVPVKWFRDPIPLESLPEWRSSLVELPIDPEYGPGWRLAVQVLDDGSCALSILVSHTIADGQAAIQAMVDAVAGRPLDPGFPAPSWRWSPVLLARDAVESARALPEVVRALATLLRRPRTKGADAIPHSTSRLLNGQHDAPEPTVDVPLVHVVLDEAACEARAADLGVASNTLLAAFATRLAFRLGRVDASGRVKLVLPVSDRQPGDRRGNALRAITVMADPDAYRTNLRPFQRELRTALTSLLRWGDDLTPLAPLLPYVPLWLARHLERLVLGADLPVGCSLVGEMPAELSRPCGEASMLQISGLERYTASVLEQLGGRLYLVGYRIRGRILVSVSGYAPDHVTTRTALASSVGDALADLLLDGTVS